MNRRSWFASLAALVGLLFGVKPEDTFTRFFRRFDELIAKAKKPEQVKVIESVEWNGSELTYTTSRWWVAWNKEKQAFDVIEVLKDDGRSCTTITSG